MAKGSRPGSARPARVPLSARAWPFLAVGALAFAVYARTLAHALVWDDTGLVAYVDGLVRSGGLSRLLSAEFVVDSMANVSLGYYRPLVLLSLWSDGRFAATSALAYHLTNVGLHVAVSLLVFVLARRLLGSRRAALAAAAFFAVHPAHVESVAFVSGRTDLWAALFVLAAAIFWDRGRASGTRRLEPLLSGASLLAAALSKEVAFALPAVLLGLDAAGASRERGAASGWLARNGRALAAWAGALAVVAVLRMEVAHVSLGASPSPGGGWAQVVSDPARALARACLYLRLLVIPWPLNASYGIHEVTFSALNTAGAALWLALSLGTLARIDRRTGIVSTIWTLGFLLPVSGLLAYQGADVAERFLYLPSVGTALLVGTLAETAFRSVRYRRLAAAAACLVGVTLAAGTVARAGVWKDNLSLYGDIVKTSPARPLAHSNLGLEYLKAARNGDAVAELERALQLNPTFALARTNLGLAYRALGRRDEALAAFEEAARESPEHPGILSNLGDEYRETGRLPQAAAVYEKIERLAPGAPDVHFKLGLTYGGLRRLDDAAREFEAVIRLAPRAPEPHFRRGLVLAAAGRIADAEQERATLQRMGSPYAEQLRQALTSAIPPGPTPRP